MHIKSISEGLICKRAPRWTRESLGATVYCIVGRIVWKAISNRVSYSVSNRVGYKGTEQVTESITEYEVHHMVPYGS